MGPQKERPHQPKGTLKIYRNLDPEKDTLQSGDQFAVVGGADEWYTLRTVATGETFHTPALKYRREVRAETFEELQAEYLAWVAATFPDETLKDQWTHLAEEFRELEDHPTDPGEFADVLMLLLCVAHKEGVDILQAAREKFAVNRLRTWVKGPDGYRHAE